MVKEEELLKAVKANNYEKLEKLYVKTTGSFRKRAEPVPSSQELAQRSQKIKVHHMNVDYQEEDTGYTPFMIAVLNGYREIALSLFYHSADVHMVDKKGNTALHLSVFKGRSDMIDLIINCEAKINQANDDGNTPLHIAVQNCATGKLFLIFKLLQFGANLYAKNKDGHTPLDQAAVFGKQEAASALIDHDSNLRQNTRAIVEASIRGHGTMVQVLLDNGVDSNAVDKQLGTAALHEAIRFERHEVVSILLLYGADPELLNSKGETPMQLAAACPRRSQEFLRMIKESALKPKQAPRFSRMDSEVSTTKSTKRYPPLQNNRDWTQDSQEFCSSCTSNNPNFNILDDNPKSFWVIPSTSLSWCVFDLAVEHSITGITIFGWDSPQMVRKFELQKAISFEGPWTTVASFTCERLGSTDPKDPGTRQNFHGFCGSSQYWRLMIVNNHGGQCICFQGIQFYGADSRVQKFFTSVGLEHLAETFISRGYNHYDDLLTIQPADIEIIVRIKSEREKLSLALKDLKLKYYPLTVLNWLRIPATFTREGEALSLISVQADPEVNEEMELTVQPLGGSADCVVKGNCRAFLKPNGPKDVSVATFDDIELCTVGTYVFEVRSVRFPRIFTRADDPIQVVAAPKSNNEIAAAFDDISSMLADMSSSLTM